MGSCLRTRAKEKTLKNQIDIKEIINIVDHFDSCYSFNEENRYEFVNNYMLFFDEFPGYQIIPINLLIMSVILIEKIPKHKITTKYMYKLLWMVCVLNIKIMSDYSIKSNILKMTKYIGINHELYLNTEAKILENINWETFVSHEKYSEYLKIARA